MMPFKSKALGEWLQNSFKQKTEHWTSDCTTPCLPQTQSRQCYVPSGKSHLEQHWKLLSVLPKQSEVRLPGIFQFFRALHWVLKPDLHLHWSHLCVSVKVAWRQPQPHSCQFPWPSCTPVQVVAGAGRDAMVLLKSQMAAKAFLPTGATEIAFGCPRFSLGLSTSKI